MPAIVPIPGFFEPFGSMLHLLAAGAAAIGGTWFVARGRGRVQRSLLAAFVLAAVVMLSLSGTYHLLDAGTTGRAVLQRLDHAAIWTMIAASFTAIHGIALRGRWRGPFLAVVWTAAITGLVLEAVFFTSLPEWGALSLYLALGWLGVLSAFVLARTRGWRSLRDLMLGGAAYSLGAVYDFAGTLSPIPGVIGPHEVFHVGVVLGVLLHARFILGLLPACARASARSPAMAGMRPVATPS